MSIMITGGAGFIGSHLIRALNRLGYSDIFVVDDLTNGRKFTNLVGAGILDYIDIAAFREQLQSPPCTFDEVSVLFHLGACTDTTEWDGRYMMDMNYQSSKEVLQFCMERQVQLIYASSAAVYGLNQQTAEELRYEKPLNVYGYSKWLFDQYVRRMLSSGTQFPVTGLRFFNVYGRNEHHKGNMASVLHHFRRQLESEGVCRLFGPPENPAIGEAYRRDFVYVEDVVDVLLWCWRHQSKGIFNVGTGEAQPFEIFAQVLIEQLGVGRMEYIPLPESLRSSYQAFTQADLSRLRKAGYSKRFTDLKAGVLSVLNGADALIS